jgi:hypothetical protein
MFNFLKKEDKYFNDVKLLVEKIFSLLPAKFLNIKKQLDDKILIGYKKQSNNYTKFILRTDVLNKYEDKKGNYFEINGIKVFDKTLQNFTDINLEIGYGILIGISTPGIKKLDPDVSQIDVSNFRIKGFENYEYEKVKSLLDPDDLKLISPNDVYELELDGGIYYHLKDLEDGDFLGIDNLKKIYKITHDPYKITEVYDKLSELI